MASCDGVALGVVELLEGVPVLEELEFEVFFAVEE